MTITKTATAFLSVLLMVVTGLQSISSEFTELRLYQYPEYKGTYVSFVQKQPDLSDWKFFTGKSQSFNTFPARYHWFGFDEPEYQGAAAHQFLSNDNLTYESVNSIRYVGAQDANTRAISFYRHTFFRSDEHYSENAAGTGIPFGPTSLAITGGASYTLFEGTDFNGHATCMLYISSRRCWVEWRSGYPNRLICTWL